MAETQEESIVEEREEFMISFKGGSPTLRIAHFLKPPAKSSIHNLQSPPLSHRFTTNSKKTPLKVSFPGWRFPQRKWESWQDRMRVLHQLSWKKTGIYEAIISCSCITRRCNDIIFELAKRWHSETNTFVFPWGEATFTLEDMIALGGYSVLGDPIWKTPRKELKMVEAKLENQLFQLGRQMPARKADHSVWINHFTENQSEVEHEAFLSMWLSRFVFPQHPKSVIRKYVFPIAVLLARGTVLALAPAVLATIYRDLSLLNHNLSIGGDGQVLTLWSPLQLVQMWALYRFPSLRADLVKSCQPRCVRWHNAKVMKVKEVALALDSEMESFEWRPYVIQSNYSFLSPNFYSDYDKWVSVNELDDDLQSLGRCFQVSELVGMDCIEQYLPIRVAMQFGMDQDLPIRVHRLNRTKELGWKNYSRPIEGSRLYISSRLFKADVTARYLQWWKQASLSCEGDENQSSDLSVGDDVCCPIILESDDEFMDEDEIGISQPLTSPPRNKHKRTENRVTSSYEGARKKMKTENNISDIQPPITGSKSCSTGSNQKKCPKNDSKIADSDDDSKESHTMLGDFENGDDDYNSKAAMEEIREGGFIEHKLEEIERLDNNGRDYGDDNKAATEKFQSGLGDDDLFEGEKINILEIEELALELDDRVSILEGVFADLKHKRS